MCKSLALTAIKKNILQGQWEISTAIFQNLLQDTWKYSVYGRNCLYNSSTAERLDFV